MIRNFASFVFIMLFASDIWAVYGLGLPQLNSIVCEDCQVTSTSGHFVVTKVFETPVPAISTAAITPTNASPLATPPPVAPPANLQGPTASDTHDLSDGVKAAIGISVVVIIVLLLAFLVLGIPQIRSRRRTQALQRAVEEVERGVEMQKPADHVSEAMSDGKDNMVLESRVEIVVEDGASERNVVDTWDGWNATYEGDDTERGRQGMSLPRREY
ncbi:hypothetical protein HBI30_090740 [Parastagonospora nodorum]|nr:hypothetical protein HBI30_090740 [Parastagonospora nodorum]